MGKLTSPEGDMSAETHPPVRNNAYVYLISIIAAVGGFLLTYDIIIMSGAIIFLKKEFNLTPTAVGFAMTSAILACFVSPSLGGWLADRVGRKRTLIAAAGMFALSAIGTAYPSNITEFNIFRILGGFGVGAACIVSPMYIAEIAPAYIRGRLVFITQVSNVVGALISYVVTYALSFSGNWRWMFGSTAIPAVIFLAGLAFVPESPRWLVLKGRIDEALRGLRRIGNEETARAELQAIRESSNPVKPKLLDLLKPGIRIALLIAVGLAILQQFDGVTVLLFYAPTIMQEAGFPQASKAIFISLLIGGWNLICTIVAFWLVDWVGRRPLLLYGTIGMALGLAIMGVFFKYHVTGIAVPLTMMLAVAAYSMTLAPVMWLIMAEIFPNQVRGMGMAVASTALWIADFGANFSFPIMTGFFERHFGSAAGAFWVFAGICLFTFYFCWRLVPETKGKTLEEIASWWEPNSKVAKELA
ncbi:MAG: sugar porter family MFS transporter [Candidatus Acidiferrales bacterium]|jgi:SP family arabinose:H+ symporter-like MFS transporter